MLTKEVKQINFTFEKLQKFEKMYETAKAKGQPQFVFEGYDILTDYAKYLIAYLYMQFGSQLKAAPNDITTV
jgi:hypothetical protein